MKLNEKTGLYENFEFWHVPFWQTPRFKIGVGVFFGLIVISLMIMCTKRYLIYKKRKKLPIWDQALLDLSSLKKENKITVEHGKEFYETISGLLKKYCNDRFSYHIIGKTDNETVEYLTQKQFDPSMLEDIKSIFQGAEIIKFANAQAAQEQIEQDYLRAMSIIQKTIPEKTHV